MAELGKMAFSETAEGSSAYSITSDNAAIGVRVVDQSLTKAFNGTFSVSALATSQTLEFSGFSSKNALLKWHDKCRLWDLE